ncbi:hypothetical protein [Deinococcus sp. Leaf326]|uniref:hypothetical protein n=1 Tax=Deinococcus sp. Leaf326 TaxID=1736338 RepID=UPI0006F9D66E|nr:hypothetical protein [Deinococcus sp. Leaf326]KQR01758.1 hypothetical protein ASF71_21570 [Deinococcus sp. Leaf326]
MLDAQLKMTLLEGVLIGRISAYDATRTLLELVGLTTFERAVQASPHSCPKTLRRVFSQGKSLIELPTLPGDAPIPLQEIDVELTALAAEAKVDPKQVISSVLRYGNPFARVKGVLEDLRALVVNECRVTNPTGLFVRLMRSGEDVRLPASVQAKRETKAKHEAPPLKPLPEVGDWVKYQGDWLRVEAVLERKIRLYAPEGRYYHYFAEDSDTDVSFEQARLLPRQAMPPVSSGGQLPLG